MTQVSRQQIAKHVRAMLKSVKRRPKDLRELAYALAAARIVCSALERAAREENLGPEIMGAIDDLSRSSDQVMELCPWR